MLTPSCPIRTKSAVSIWSLYIDFELRQQDSKRAKRLLHRALAECPWAKGAFAFRYMVAYTEPGQDTDEPP